MVGKVVDGVSSTFIAGDMLGVATHFNAANLTANKPVVPKSSSKSGRFQKWGRKSTQSSEKSSSDSSPMPEGFPRIYVTPITTDHAPGSAPRSMCVGSVKRTTRLSSATSVSDSYIQSGTSHFPL